MSTLTDLLRARSGGIPFRRRTRIIVLSAATAGVGILVVLVVLAGAPHSPPHSPLSSSPPRTAVTVPPAKAKNTPYPIGRQDKSEPSGMAPPGKDALPGYGQTYANDFNGAKLPTGWEKYSGVPGGDPGSQWGLAHVVVGNGMLQLKTYEDPAYGGKWVTGGLCQCGHSQTYGAYFVRSRVTGAGPTNVELLWPAAPVWPPEIDFNETGGATVGTSATVHWGADSNVDQRADQTVIMTQWHTWGVIWTPTSITYTVDGQVWGTVTVASEIPDQPMTLDLQQQASCFPGYTYACPTAPVSMQIDWVAEYAPK